MRIRLPASTRPPMRNGRPCGASFATTCDGVKKNTRFDWNAFSTSATATPSTTTPAPIQAKRRWRAFIARASVARARPARARAATSPRAQRVTQFEPTMSRAPYAIGAPDVEAIAAHRERIRSCMRFAACSGSSTSIHAAPRSRSRMIAAHAQQRDGDRIEPRGERHDQHAGQHDRRHLRRRGHADRRRPGAACSTTAPRNR